MNLFMNFLKKLFSGGGGDRNVMTLYVRPFRCDEVLEVRVNLFNDLSPTEDYQGYYCRKLVHGARCPFPSELHLHFDKNRNLQQKEIEKGELVSAEEYEAYIAQKEGPQPTG